MYKVLIVTDSANKNWNKILHNHNNNNQYFLHSVNTNAKSVLQVIQKYPSYKDFTITEIDSFEISQLAEEESRDYYLKFIRDLPNKKIFNGRSITDLLTVNDRNYWWYLQISEKNIWLDRSIHRFFEISRLQHILNNDEYDKMICCLDDGILQASFQQMAMQRKIPFTSNITKHRKRQGRIAVIMFCLKYFINASRAIISLYIKIIFVLNSKTNKNIDIANGTIGFFSFFPLFWKDIETDQPEDIFFNKIPDEIENNNQVLHLIWLSPWKKLFSNKNWLKRLQKNKKIYILENTLKLKDTLSLFYLDIFRNLLFILFSKRKVQIGTIEGIKIDDIVYEEFFRSFSSPAFFQTLLLDRALQKTPLKKCKLLFFRLEFQPHERAILYNTKGKVKSIGFQHSALSKNFLNYVFMKDELARHWEQGTESSSMPLPDHIFTSGQVGFDYMSSAGYPEDHLFVCGGVRYDDLRKNVHLMSSKNELRIQHNIPNKKKIILVTTTPIIHETVAMLNSIYFAIQHLERDKNRYHIIIKHHPNTKSMKNYIDKTGKVLNHWQNIISHEIVWGEINVHEYIKMSDVVITTGGTTPLEAMIIGIPSIIFSLKIQFSHNPLIDYPQSALFVHNSSSMQSALEKINEKARLESFYNEWKVPINDMFGNYSKNQNQRFINLLSSI